MGTWRCGDEVAVEVAVDVAVDVAVEVAVEVAVDLGSSCVRSKPLAVSGAMTPPCGSVRARLPGACRVLAGRLPGACRPLRTMRPMSHPRPLAASPRRGWLWAGLLCALLASLLGSQWLGLLHAQLHPGAHARLQAVAHAHAGHPAQGPSWAGLPPEPGDEAPHAHAAHAGSGAGGSLLLELLELLDQHELGSAACQLLDQLGHAAPSDGLVLLSPPSWGLLQQAARASVGPRRQAWTRPPARAPPSVG